jgi:leucyl aminopeptidase
MSGAIRITSERTPPAEARTPMIAIAVARPPALAGPAAALDEALAGALGRLVEDGEVRGTAGSATTLHVPADSPLGARRVTVVGLGRAEDVGSDAVRSAAGAAARAARTARVRDLAFALDGLPLAPADAARCVVEGVVLGAYRFDRYRTGDRDERPPPLASLTLLATEDVGDAARRAGIVAAATNRARDLQSTPPNDMTPEHLARRAREIAAASDAMTAAVLDEAGIAAHGMGAFAAVARASGHPPRLITLRYEPPGADGDVVLGLVGKGVTFDAGGLSIKTRAGLIGMKADMSGGAAVLEAIAAIAELGLPLRVVTVVGATENMLDANAFKVDEVVRTASGKTVEITNTDAEGRLVLADCLHHARAAGATHLVDVATLTGAVVTALGDQYAGVMGRDDAWIEQVREAGERAGEHVWRLPLHDRWRRLLRSPVADMKNSDETRMAGSAVAARFLQEFAGDGPWAHLDIAGVADLDRQRGDEMGKGPTGFGVRLLVELAESLC